MRDKRFGVGIAILAVGAGLNFLDAYFSGNLSFSPEASDQNNKVSLINRFQRPAGATGLNLGTILAIVGGGILVVSWLVGRRK